MSTSESDRTYIDDQLTVYGRRPFPYSNDRWTWGTVRGLKRRLAQQQTPPQERAALVVGAGGLPYLLGLLRVATVDVVDLDARVLNITASRVGLLKEHDGWDRYNDTVSGLLGNSSEHTNELWAASRSHLMRRYDHTRAGAEQAELQLHHGDLLEIASTIGQRAVDAGQIFTFVNVTNVAGWVATNEKGSGHRLVNEALRSLPLAPEAVIVDSSPTLVPRLYSVEKYMTG